jgi:hypothetical protein
MKLNLAGRCNFTMVVKNFGTKEVDFTRQQHAHNQGAQPMVVTIIAPASHLDGSPFLSLALNFPA